MNVDSPQQIDLTAQCDLNLGGNPVAVGHTQRAVDADGDVDDKIRPKAMRLRFFDLLDAGTAIST